jgi:hypothetical protein
MSLIKCQECRQEISSEAEVCPHCGFRLREVAKLTRRGRGNGIGCLGFVAIVIVALFAWYVVSTNTESDHIRSGQATAEELKVFCAAAFVDAQHLAPAAMSGAEIGFAEPAIIRPGPPTRIQCGYFDRGHAVGGITADVVCSRNLEPSCVRVVAVLEPGGGLAYAAPDDAKSSGTDTER